MESFALGVENEASALFSQMHALAQQPGAAVRVLTIEDAADFFRTAKEKVDTLLARYERGEIPVHLLVAHTGIPLARLFHESPTQSQQTQTPLRTAPVFIRHGSKAGNLPSQPSRLPQVLFLDVTSLILARSIGILDIVERNFQTIVISASLTQSLLEQLDVLSSQQPTLLKAHQKLLALVRDGLVKTTTYADPTESNHTLAPLMGERWCARLSKAKEAGGLMVDHFPLVSNCLPLRPVTLMPDIEPFVVSERQLVCAMAAAGLVSAVETESISKTFVTPEEHPARETTATGTTGTPTAPASAPGPHELFTLRQGMPVFFEHSVAGGLAQSVALERLGAFCRVFVDQDEIDGVESGIKGYDRNQCLKEWVTDLLAHVSRGIDSGKYRIHRHPAPTLPHESPHTFHPEELCLYDALHFGEATEAYIWCDDRAITAHDRVGKSELGDISDVLHLLSASGVLRSDAYFDYFLKLQGANARYLPLRHEEILHHLRAAKVEHGVLQETPALRTLRRHAAACVLDRDRIQEPVPDGRGGLMLREMVVAIAYQLPVLEALRTLWLEAKEPWDLMAARADWLWRGLCADIRLVVQCFGTPTAAVEWQALLADSIAHLLSLGLGLPHGIGEKAVGPSGRRLFFDWVETRAVMPLLANNPRLPQAIAERLAQHLSNAERLLSRAERDQGKESREAFGIRVVVGLYIADLPAVIQSKLELTAETLARWGLQSGAGSMVDTLGLQFPASSFWSAIARVINTGRATLFAPQGPAKLQLSRGPTPTMVRVVRKSKEPTVKGVFNNPILPLLHSDVAERNRILRAHPEWFDLDPEPRAEAIRRVASESNAALRVELLGEYRESSMASFCASLIERLREQKPMDIGELLPHNIALLRRHLRLEKDEDALAADRWPLAVQRLIEAEGLAEAVSRLSCLPAALPEPVYLGLHKLAPAERAKIMRDLTRSLVGPLQSFHFIALCIAFPGEASGILPIAEHRIKLLCDPQHGYPHNQAFRAVLTWVNLRLGWRQDTRGLPSHLRLRMAWLHASALYRSFCIARSDPKAIEDWLSSNSIELSRDGLLMHEEISCDAAAPGNVFPFGFVLRGMAYCLADAADGSRLFDVARESLAGLASACASRFSSTYPLLRELHFGRNALGSFLGHHDEKTLARLLGGDVYKIFFSVPKDSFPRAIVQLNEDPQSLEAWTRMDALLGDAPVPKQVVVCVEQAAKSVNLRAAFRQNKQVNILLALLVSKYAGKVGRPETKELVLEQIVELAREVNAAHSRTRAQLRDDEALLRLAAALPLIIGHLCVQDDAAAAAEALSRGMIRILREWPALASVGSPQLDHLIRQLPVECQRAYWPLALTVRALA